MQSVVEGMFDLFDQQLTRKRKVTGLINIFYVITMIFHALEIVNYIIKVFCTDPIRKGAISLSRESRGPGTRGIGGQPLRLDFLHAFGNFPA